MSGDIIALIDEVTADECANCGGRLEVQGPSRDFCGEPCQDRWAQQWALPGVQVTKLGSPTPPGYYSISFPPGIYSASDFNAIIEEAMRRARDDAYQLARDAMIGATNVMAGLRPTFEGLGVALSSLAEAITRTPVPQRPPSTQQVPDVVAQAIQARRNRNTGPIVRRRAPKRIDATRGQR